MQPLPTARQGRSQVLRQAPEQGRRQRLLLLALWLVFYSSFTLLSPPLLDDADSVHAEVAREMLVRHDFVTLYANGIRYLEKAPLYYWSMAACMRVLGPTALASRLPLAFAALALTLLLEAFASRLYGGRAGLYAGLITLSSFGIFIFTRINIPDAMVCVWLASALFAYAVTQEHLHPRRGLCWLFAAACALDVLTKGLIGVVFPLAIVGLHLLVTRGGRGTFTRLRQLSPVSSTLLFLLIAVPWHVMAALANPAQGHPGGLTFTGGHFSVPLPTDGNVHGWAWFYFVNEQVLRYLNLRVPRDYDTVPLWLFLGLIFIWLMPWSAFLPPALVRALPWRDQGFHTRLRTHALAPTESASMLLLLWAALPLLFFAFSTRQEYYVLPALPPMILLIADFLAYRGIDKPLAEAHRKTAARAAGVLALLGLAAAVACVYLIVRTKAPVPETDLASLLQQNPGDYALSFGHFLDLNARAMGMFRMPLALTAIAFGLGLPVAWWLRHKWNSLAANFVTAGAAFLFLFAAWRGLVIFSPTLTSAQLADAVRPQIQPADMVAIHGEYEAGSTLGFYLHRPCPANAPAAGPQPCEPGDPLHIVEGRSSNLWYGSFFPDRPPIFETRDSITQKWAGPQRIFLWQDPHDADRPVLALSPAYVIASSGGKQILSNQPNR
jgi:4-amino-4-deoxy-L-arabinose transferase-like glycosyltransferase